MVCYSIIWDVQYSIANLQSAEGKEASSTGLRNKKNNKLNNHLHILQSEWIIYYLKTLPTKRKHYIYDIYF